MLFLLVKIIFLDYWNLICKKYLMFNSLFLLIIQLYLVNIKLLFICEKLLLYNQISVKKVSSFWFFKKYIKI